MRNRHALKREERKKKRNDCLMTILSLKTVEEAHL